MNNPQDECGDEHEYESNEGRRDRMRFPCIYPVTTLERHHE